MSDELIKRLRSQDAVDARPTEIEKLTDEAADLIEQQASRIAQLEADKASSDNGKRHDRLKWLQKGNFGTFTGEEIDRQIALEAAEKEAVPVAWMYKCWDTVHLEKTQLDHYYSIDGGETYVKGVPLYTHPAPTSKDAIRREALEAAAKICDERASAYWKAYKQSPMDDVNRANPHVEGMSDGAENCANAIRALSEKE